MTGKSAKRIAFIGPFKFPDNSASARRILGLALSLNYLGHQVLIGSGQHKQEFSNEDNADPSPFTIYSLKEWPDNKESLLNRLISLGRRGKNTLDWLDELRPRPDIVFMFGGYVPYSRLILPWSHRNKIPVVVDIVEWFQPSHLPGGWIGPAYWNVELSLHYYYIRAKNIIAISHYLEDYYKGRGCHSLRIPPTLDVQGTIARTIANSEPLTLAYAGTPGKKDLVDNVIEAVLRLDIEGKKVRLVLAGLDNSDVLRLLPLRSRNLSVLPSCINALGTQPHNKVLTLVRDADFVPLLRPPLRYAQAGFPTKVPESLALGTPIICNLTSDLGDYIHDDIEGLVCRDHSVDAFAEALERALSLTSKQRSEMRQAARAQAERSFDYRIYVEPLRNFLENI